MGHQFLFQWQISWKAYAEGCQTPQVWNVEVCCDITKAALRQSLQWHWFPAFGLHSWCGHRLVYSTVFVHCRSWGTAGKPLSVSVLLSVWCMGPNALPLDYPWLLWMPLVPSCISAFPVFLLLCPTYATRDMLNCCLTECFNLSAELHFRQKQQNSPRSHWDKVAAGTEMAWLMLCSVWHILLDGTFS